MKTLRIIGVLGIVFGVLAGSVWFWLSHMASASEQTSFRPQATQTGSAATAANYANQVSETEQTTLTLALADTTASLATPATDITSFEVTLSKVEAELTHVDSLSINQPDSRWEVLNLTQPTINLFGLRGSGNAAVLATTQLAAGSYDAIRLTISSIKARRTDGTLVDTPLNASNRTILIKRAFDWSHKGSTILVTVNINSQQSLTKDSDNYVFAPIIEKVLQDNQVLVP